MKVLPALQAFISLIRHCHALIGKTNGSMPQYFLSRWKRREIAYQDE